jgi:hypothetical protein
LMNPVARSEPSSCQLLAMRDVTFFELLRETRKPPSQGSCRNNKPETNVVFLKTHKTGSSTLTNMFNRYAFVHNLTSALPIDDIYYNWPRHIDKSVAYPPGKSVDSHSFQMMAAGHALYNRELMDKIVPNARYITVLRHPYDHFVSNWQYFGISRYFDDNGNPFSIDSFLTNPTHNIQRILPEVYQYFIHNSLSFDLGLSDNPDLTQAENNVARLADPNTGFFFVLIREYMDESLVILRRKLCWDIEDIVTYSLKISSSSSRPVFSLDSLNSLRSFNRMDFLLYEHFNRTLWEEIDRQGGIEDEVAQLRDLRTKTIRKCSQYKRSDHETRFRLMTMPLDTEESRCSRLMLDSMDFSKVLKMVQGIPFKECVIPGTMLDITFIRPRFIGTFADALTNIFLRKAANRNAPVALPEQMDADYVSSYSVYSLKGVEKRASILATGSFVYNDVLVRSFTKADYGRYVTIVPDPVESFMHGWHETGIGTKLRSLGEPEDVLLAIKSPRREVIELLQTIRNSFAQTFRSVTSLDTKDAANTILRQILFSNAFIFVIPSDSLDAGLLYLQRILCWEPDEFLYLPPRKDPFLYRSMLDMEVVTAIARFNSVDSLIFREAKKNLESRRGIELGFSEEIVNQRRKRYDLLTECEKIVDFNKDQLSLAQGV